MPRQLPELLQFFAIAISLVLTPLWIVVALAIWPWIVPADHNTELVRAYEKASKATVALSLVSLLTVVLASGVIKHRGLRWRAAIVLIAGIGVVACFFLPLMSNLMRMTFGGISVAGLVALVVLAAAFGRPVN